MAKHTRLAETALEMKLATLKDRTRDGKLIVVKSDVRHAVSAQSVAATMQEALDDWANLEPQLQSLAAELNADNARDVFAFNPQDVAAPLPRAYQWCDGSAFLNHGRLMEKAFNTPPMPDFETVPLMYQGGSDDFLGACDDAMFLSEEHGIDFEGEYGVIVDDVPMGCRPEQAASHIKLIVQINDWSLRGFGPREMKPGFGFFRPSLRQRLLRWLSRLMNSA